MARAGRLAADNAQPLLGRYETLAAEILAKEHPAARIGTDLQLLLTQDLSDHPWTALVVAAALHDVRRGDPLVERLIGGAQASFTARGDARGSGYVSYVQGSVSLGHGRLDAAVGAWRRCRESLSAGAPMDEALVGMVGLQAYQEGKLHEAVAFAEEALALARLRQNPRQELSAQVYLAFFTLSLGQCARAAVVLHLAQEVAEMLVDPDDRADLPLLLAGQGVLGALRGDQDTAERCFGEALDLAAKLSLSWHGAIVRCLRAEFLVAWDPERCLCDARLGSCHTEGAGRGLVGHVGRESSCRCRGGDWEHHRWNHRS